MNKKLWIILIAINLIVILASSFVTIAIRRDSVDMMDSIVVYRETGSVMYADIYYLYNLNKEPSDPFDLCKITIGNGCEPYRFLAKKTVTIGDVYSIKQETFSTEKETHINLYIEYEDYKWYSESWETLRKTIQHIKMVDNKVIASEVYR